MPTEPQTPAPQEQMVEVEIEPGKKIVEPLSKVVGAYRLKSQMERDRASFEAQRKQYEGKVSFADAVMNAAAVDPKLAKEQVARWIDMQTGGGNAAPAPQPDVQIDDDAPRPDPKVQQHIDRLEQRLAGIEQAEMTRMTRGEIKEALDGYPLLTKDEQSRELAELLITQQRAINPKAPIDQLAAEAHTRILKIKGQEVAAERDVRKERQNTMPTLPAAAGSPEMAARPRATEKDLRNGSARKSWEAAYAQGGFKAAMRLINGRK